MVWGYVWLREQRYGALLTSSCAGLYHPKNDSLWGLRSPS